MGTWGTGIFDDDTGCDVRSHYRRALRAGVPGPQATDQILRDHAPSLDPFDIPVWLGLAATQTQLGQGQGLGDHRLGGGSRGLG
jgi:hypothetical protein